MFSASPENRGRPSSPSTSVDEPLAADCDQAPASSALMRKGGGLLWKGTRLDKYGSFFSKQAKLTWRMLVGKRAGEKAPI